MRKGYGIRSKRQRQPPPLCVYCAVVSIDGSPSRRDCRNASNCSRCSKGKTDGTWKDTLKRRAAPFTRCPERNGIVNRNIGPFVWYKPHDCRTSFACSLARPWTSFPVRGAGESVGGRSDQSRRQETSVVTAARLSPARMRPPRHPNSRVQCSNARHRPSMHSP